MKILRTLGCVVFAMLVLAAPASAAFTASSITTPASGAEMFFDGDSGSGSVTVRGAVTGMTPGSRGDVLCYTVNDTRSFKVASNIVITPSGTFATSASLLPIAGFACRLAFVPVGQAPTGDAAAVFAGPAISISDQFSHSNFGNTYGYFILAGTLPWSYAFQSLGECPINSSFATDESSLGSFSLFVGNGCLLQSSGVGPTAGTRSALVIDGDNAYPPGAIKGLAMQAGFEPLGYTTTYDAQHDTVTINELEVPMICDPPATFPPTSTTCPSLHDSGLAIAQTTTLLPGGQVARVTDRLTSVDGRSHTVDAEFSQSVAGQAADETPGFQFPGQSSFATQAAPYSFSGFPPGPGSIITISNANGFLPATSNPVGAITYGRPPLSADFTSAKGSQTATFLMHYADTVPAGGSVVYNWSYEQAASSGSLATLEQVERDRFSVPSVFIGQPKNNSTTGSQVIRVRGQALDSVGITSLIVNGRSVAVRPGGIFGTNLSLKTGKNVILATATNVAGNKGSSRPVTVIYKPAKCKVPNLRGKTLKAARNALKHNHCEVGKLIRVSSRQVRKGRIVSTTPKAGTTHRHGYKIRLKVSRG